MRQTDMKKLFMMFNFRDEQETRIVVDSYEIQQFNEAYEGGEVVGADMWLIGVPVTLRLKQTVDEILQMMREAKKV